MQRATGYALIGTALTATTLVACSDGAISPPGAVPWLGSTGGALGSGAATGGTSDGGPANGGTSNGDASVGAAAGGTGGAASGGTSAGGTASGGTSTGGAAAGGTAGVAALPAPGTVLNLSTWHLTLPIEDPSTGWALQINQPELATYSKNPYFLTVPEGAGVVVVFQTPVDGVKTSNNTKFARTELREDYLDMPGYPDTGNRSWSMTDGRTHTLTIVEKITYLPLKHPEQALGQIHDPNNDTFMLKAVGNNEGKGIRSTSFRRAAQFDDSSVKKDMVLSGGGTLWVPFDTYFTLQLVVKSGTCIATVQYEGQTYTASNATWATIDQTKNYFKAGNYIQSNVADYAEATGDYSTVVIQSLSVTHQ